MKFEPSEVEKEKPKVVVYREGRVTKSRIIYPERKRTLVDEDQYDFEYEQRHRE